MLRQGEDDDEEEEGLELETLAFESLYCGKINITIYYIRLILSVSFAHQRSFSLSLSFPGSLILEASDTALRETGKVRRGNIFLGSSLSLCSVSDAREY